MKVEKVIIFTDGSFPNGMAVTNRTISYGKGFNHNGVTAEVICLRREETKDNIKNTEVKGVFEGIKFKYLTSSTIKSRYFILRRIQNFNTYIYLFLFSLKKLNNSTISIYYSDHTVPAIILWLVIKIKGGKLLKEESEHPSVYFEGKNLVAKFLLKNVHYKLFDAYLLMTKNLISYFNSVSKTPVIHVPMTVDLNRFDPNLKNHHKTINKILYTGQLDDYKDGVDILLKAFASIVKNHRDYHLYLYGSANSDQKLQEYHKMVKRLGIDEFVHFEGLVNREVITEKVLNAKILVLPRPDSIQAQNGFPTKLGEYLASGNPTLVTSVGEIPNYLTDRENTFMATPGDVKSLENKLFEIIEDYEFAKEVGLKGRKTAEIHFNNIHQTKSIINYFE